MKKIFLTVAVAALMGLGACNKAEKAAENEAQEAEANDIELVNEVAPEEAAAGAAVPEVVETAEAVREVSKPAEPAKPQAKQPAVEKSPVKVAPGEVKTPSSDAQYRPGMKPAHYTVLDFNATWCGPCRRLTPIFDAAAKAHGEIDFISIDVDKFPATAGAFGVNAVPTVIFMAPDGTSRTFTGISELVPAENFDKVLKAFTGK